MVEAVVDTVVETVVETAVDTVAETVRIETVTQEATSSFSSGHKQDRDKIGFLLCFQRIPQPLLACSKVTHNRSDLLDLFSSMFRVVSMIQPWTALTGIGI